MQARPDHDPAVALLRMLGARIGASAIAMFAFGPRSCRLLAASAAISEFWAEGGAEGWCEPPAAIVRALAGGDAVRLDPRGFGAASFVAVAPVGERGAARRGFLLVFDRRARRMTHGLVEALRDGGALAAPLLASSRPAPPRQPEAHGGPASSLETSLLELDLARAPVNGQMHLVYQPYVELAGGSVSGAEALLRWRHPVRGELRPATFIPLAEATGLILPIGDWALRRALIEAARWPAGLALSVNISALQFHQPGFTAQVAAALAAAGFPPERLELEITETVLMRDSPATTARLRALIDRGIRIALDDFGTGYSALAYLARLPHHRIKLDRAFVQDLANPATAELIRAIIALARSRGVAVTAEGVELPHQLAEVRRFGFTHAQGYATGRPVPDPTALLAEPAPAELQPSET